MADQKIVTETALSAFASDVKDALNNLLPTDTASGSIATFSDGADNIPVKSLVSQIVAVESGSGEKSPDNPYSISGFDSGIITRCGKNIWNETTKNGYWNTTNGNYVSVAGQLCSNDYISVKENTAYYFYKGSNTNQSEVLFYDESKTFISYLNYSQCVNKAFTTPSNCAYITFNLGSNYGTTYLNNISFNYPSTDTQYHAYNGNTYTFPFGQTVYGGRLIYANGQWSIEATHGIIELSNMSWTYDGVNVRFYSMTLENLAKMPSSYSEKMNGVCDIFNVDSAENWNINYTITLFPNGVLTAKDTDYTDATTFKTAMNGHKLVYELANPITLAITSQDISTLLGENNIFSNCGDVEVIYRADIGLYIDKKLNP